MSSVSGIRMPGLATGMDTETMVKEMLTGEKNKVDKAKQKEQTIKWKQEIYRDVIKDIKGFQDNYFSITSPNSIISSKAWNTLSVSSSNSNVITATGSAGANNVDYTFDVKKLAQSPKVSSKISSGGTIIKSDSKLSNLGLAATKEFTIKYGEGDTEISKTIKIDPTDDISSLIKNINESTNGEIKASFSEMTGEFTIENSKTGSKSKLEIKSADGQTSSDALDFLGMKSKNNDGTYTDFKSGTVISGSAGEIDVYSGGNKVKTLNEELNSFAIDGVNYTVNTTGTASFTSKQDVKPVVDNMKKFVEDYNKIMDKIYSLVTQKTEKGYPPLTEEQKKDMSEDEIKKWEEKAKKGLLRDDSEMRKFTDHMQSAIFGSNTTFLNECGLTSNEDYTKRGQLSLNQEKFTKALQNNGQKVYETFAKNDTSILEKMKDTMYNHVGTSSSVFAKKAGIEKTASVAKNFYSEQIQRQEENIKMLQRKMDGKEDKLYKKFSQLESSMNKLNSQMNYFSQM